MKDRANSEVVRLTGFVLDGEATPEQFERLQELLRESTAARFTYRTAVSLHTALSATYSKGPRNQSTARPEESELPSSFELIPTSASDKACSPKWCKIVAVVCTTALIMVGIGLLASRHTSETTPKNGTRIKFLKADRAVQYPDIPIAAGTEMNLTDFRLSHGFVELELPNSVIVSVMGPGRLVMRPGRPIQISSGLANVQCENQNPPLCIETPDAVIRCQSSKFGIDVLPGSGRTDIAVLRGSINVDRPQATDGSQRKWTILSGNSARFAMGKKLGPMPVALRHEFNPYLLRATDNTVVSAISESPSPNHPGRTYFVVQDGMKERRSPFMDRPDLGWVPLQGKGFPTMLLGADLVKTYQQDRWRRNFSMTLTFEQPAELFVLLDIKATPPSWLTREFKKTKEFLRANPIEKRDAPFGTRYEIWSRTVQPGTVTLGRPYPLTQQQVTSMYGVAFRILDRHAKASSPELPTSPETKVEQIP